MLEPLKKRIGTSLVGKLCIVMACEDLSEAAQVSVQLSQVNKGTLITYRRAKDIVINPPSGRVALIILSDDGGPEAIGGILTWMRRRWPRCPITVIGETGGGEDEMTARKGGASYLTRPVSAGQWAGLIRHALGAERQEAAKDRTTGPTSG